MKVAQGQRGTSAALGERYKMISSPFSNLGWGGGLPRAAASRLHPITARQAAASPWAIYLAAPAGAPVFAALRPDEPEAT